MPDVPTLQAELRELRRRFIELGRDYAALEARSRAAIATLDSEREANAKLTDEVEKWKRLALAAHGKPTP